MIADPNNDKKHWIPEEEGYGKPKKPKLEEGESYPGEKDDPFIKLPKTDEQREKRKNETREQWLARMKDAEDNWESWPPEK